MTGRRPDGSCPACGQWDLPTAPRGCTRCALEECEQHGDLVLTREELLANLNDLWQSAISHYYLGWLDDGLFHVYVGFEGGRLAPFDDPDHRAGVCRTADEARRLAEQAILRHEHVWVLTEHGAWSARPFEGLFYVK